MRAKGRGARLHSVTFALIQIVQMACMSAQATTWRKRVREGRAPGLTCSKEHVSGHLNADA